MFYIAAAVYVFGTVFYIIFGSGQRQPWALQAQEPADNVEEEPDAEPAKKDTAA